MYLKKGDIMVKVLMICHGNICRSTMAEFVLKDMVKKLNMEKDFLISSAGTSREELGRDTHYGTKEKLKEMSIPFAKRKARQVRAEEYNEYDYLICMDKNNLRALERIIGGDIDGKVHLLLDFCGQSRDISDPWYTGDFSKTYIDISKGCEGFLKYIKKI